jgi:hypothetical protein
LEVVVQVEVVTPVEVKEMEGGVIGNQGSAGDRRNEENLTLHLQLPKMNLLVWC